MRAFYATHGINEGRGVEKSWLNIYSNRFVVKSEQLPLTVEYLV